MPTKKIKPELYWTWNDCTCGKDCDCEEGDCLAGPYSTVEEILAEAAQDNELYLHAAAVRPGGPLVAKILVGKAESLAPNPKQITMDMAGRVVDFLTEDLDDHACSGYEMKGTYKQQRQSLKQLQELLKTWCTTFLISTTQRLIKPETHVVPFNPLQYRTLKLKRRLADIDISMPVMPEVQPALDALKKALDDYNRKP